MSTAMRKIVAFLGAVALLVALLGPMATTSSAANLTGGTYTYVINGEEATFPFDPVKVGGGLLLPVEVFQKFGVTVDGALTRTITLKLPKVSARLTLGSTTYELDGRTLSLEAAPLRLNGRLFIPGQLLQEFGVDFSVDGNYVIMRDYTDGMATIKETTESEFKSFKIGRNFSRSIKADSNINLYTDFTLLSPELLSAVQLDVSYGNRARLQSLLQAYTLVMVKVSNTSVKAGAVQTTGFYLVDDQRRQYDLIETLDIDAGSITEKLAPSADRMGVLLFPKAAGDAQLLSIYFDPNGEILGTFTHIR